MIYTSCVQNRTTLQHIYIYIYIYIRVKSSENVTKFKYLGMILINENSIHERIMSRFNSQNSCKHSTQNLLSSHLPCKNTKINIKAIILPTVLYGCETQSLSLLWRK